jgi:hypothetical protein
MHPRPRGPSRLRSRLRLMVFPLTPTRLYLALALVTNIVRAYIVNKYMGYFHILSAFFANFHFFSLIIYGVDPAYLSVVTGPVDLRYYP